MNRGGRGAGRSRAGAAAGTRSSTENTATGAARTPSATPMPGPGRAPSTTPGRTPGPTRASRAPSAITGRFRPKNVRRDEAERDSIARAEEKKASDRAAAEEKRARGRGRFRAKRSRGDAMGARGRGYAVAASAGPFSGGTAGSLGRGGYGGGGGGGVGGGQGGEGFGSKSGGGGSGSRVKGEGPSFAQAKDPNREPRINADKLHVMEPEEELDSDDERMISNLSTRASVMPMGIYRKKHQETEVVVATTAELEAAENAGEEESLWVDGDSSDSQPPPEQPAEEGVWDTGNAKPVAIKPDPDGPATTNESPMEIDSGSDAVEETKEDKPKVEVKVKKAPPKDPEDRVIQSDLDLLASELGTVTVTDENGETRTTEPTDKDGRMYLLQFPPLLPPLKAGPAAQPKSKVKAENDEFSMVDAPPAPSDAVPVDLTEGDEDESDVQEQENDKQGFMSSLLSQGGMVGKLNVRKSGKVELDWGGTTLEMSPATGMNFLSSAVIMEENDEKPTPGIIGGEGIGMGKIMGRFVLAPVWGEEEDWDVAPEELETPEQ